MTCSLSRLRDRIDPATFNLPVNEIRRGYRSAVYFWRAKRVLELQDMADEEVTMQVFQKKDNTVVCGIDEVVAVLKTCAGTWKDMSKAEELFDLYMTEKKKADHGRAHEESVGPTLAAMASYDMFLGDQWENHWDRLEVKALHDGDTASAWEPVMHIAGPLASFAHLESVYLGILARRSKVATNVRHVVEAAGSAFGDSWRYTGGPIPRIPLPWKKGKPILCFADRFDIHQAQDGDGYAAMMSGATGVASDAMANWWGERGIGTMPHALIAAFGGDTALATEAFHKIYPDVPLIALVDFNNDCVVDSLECLEALGGKLWGVRLDTSENLVDESVHEMDMGRFKPTGVNIELVCNVREALDAKGGQDVKIIVSGGFTAEKIRAFEDAGAPVDIYAVGSSLLQGSIDYTSDVVLPTAKVGRKYIKSNRLELVT